MRIAFVIFRADPALGGAERYAIDLARQLTQRGHDVSVLAREFGDIAPLTAIPIPCNALTRTAAYHLFLDGVEQRLARTSFDRVHAFLPLRACDIYHAQAGLETISLAEGHRLKSSPWERSFAQFFNAMNRKRRAFAEVERRLIEGPRPPITICLSKRERDAARQRFAVAPERIVALYNGIDTRRFEPRDLIERRRTMRKQLGIADERPLLLFIGNDFARKGLDTAIRALGQLPNRDVQLLVVGSDTPDRYANLAARCDAVGRVLFAGRSDCVSEFLAAADLLVLPSRFEPFGMVVVEAMLMGVPPIVSRTCGASEVIVEGVDGVVIQSPNDVRSWSNAIAAALEPATRQSISRACLARRDAFGYASHVSEIEKLYANARSGFSINSTSGPAEPSERGVL